jgi:hypothetical protein
MMHIAKKPSHQRTTELFSNQSGKRDRLHLLFIVFCTIALHHVATQILGIPKGVGFNKSYSAPSIFLLRWTPM